MTLEMSDVDGHGVVRAGNHLARVRDGLDLLEEGIELIETWGGELHDVLAGGGRLLVVGNGGSAAQAQHLAAELVGRYRAEREPFSAFSLTADSATLTAIGNDYGIQELFARQVAAHGRPGDVLLALSTSGRSTNVVRAVRTARELGMRTWALTGMGPNPLVRASSSSFALASEHTATIQEVHQVAVHLLCEAFDEQVEAHR
ncbi:MAG: phosphoheptose isomerase [Acidimicrobiales bacterium]|nr:phosphoheptose isomerase [Acidimicrobiales bacterium]